MPSIAQLPIRVAPAVDIISFAFDRIEEYDPDHPIYVDAEDSSQVITAGQVRCHVEQFAAILISHGVKRDDCVCIHSFNSIWYPILWLSIIAVGGIVTGSNPSYTSTELKHHLDITNAKVVIVQESCLSTVKGVVLNCEKEGSPILVLGIGDVLRSCSNVQSSTNDHSNLESHLKRNAFDDEVTQDETLAVYAATSGTTGLPKAAELSHKYIVIQAAILEEVWSKRNGKLRQLLCLPVFHAFAAQIAIILPLRLGFTTYFMPRFNLQQYINNVTKYRITDSAVVPPIVSALLEADFDDLSSLEYIICAGAPMTASVQTRLYSKLSANANITQCWGLTELGWITMFPRNERDFSGSVGRLLPDIHMKIVNEHGEIVTGDRVHGEARIKSPSMFKQYRNNPVANVNSFDEEGHYMTGDRVYTDNGRVYIDGRIKDTMKVNGWQVSPEELEGVILEHPDVQDCAVVGHIVIAASGLEEVKPRAYVVCKENSTITEHDVRMLIQNRLVRYKRLAGGVVFIHAVPRSNTGKILRRKLIEAKVVASLRAFNGSHDTATAVDIITNGITDNVNKASNTEHVNSYGPKVKLVSHSSIVENTIDSAETAEVFQATNTNEAKIPIATNQVTTGPSATLNFSSLFSTILIVTICSGMGLPGLILICFIFRRLTQKLQ